MCFGEEQLMVKGDIQASLLKEKNEYEVIPSIKKT